MFPHNDSAMFSLLHVEKFVPVQVDRRMLLLQWILQVQVAAAEAVYWEEEVPYIMHVS